MTAPVYVVEAEPLLLTIPAAAAVLSIGDRMLRRLISRGAIPTVMPDRRKYVAYEDLKSYVASLPRQGVA